MEMQRVSIRGRVFDVYGSPNDPYFRSVRGQAKNLSSFYDLAATLIDRNGIAIDIGANLGLTAMALSSIAKEVHCFEPSPAAFEALRDNIEANRLRNCIAHNAAVGGALGELDFHGSADSSGSHVVSDGHAAKASTPTFKVRAVTLDSVGIDADFVKIDAEGFEPQILAGARQFMRARQRIVFMEFNAWCLLAHQRVNPFDMLASILDDFDVSVVRRNSLRVPLLGTIRRGATLAEVSRENAYTFVHDHIVKHGCVDDLVLRSHYRSPNTTTLKASTSTRTLEGL